jgi:hypothetical protein
MKSFLLLNRIAFECLKIEKNSESKKSVIVPSFIPRKLPNNSKKITEDLILNFPEVIPVVEYLYSRGLTLEDSDFYWSNEPGYIDRLLIPLTVNYEIMGYIGRKINNGKPKYLTEHPPHIVFNLDKQDRNNQFVLVFEGSIDALLLGGIAVLTNEISKEQALQINLLGKQVIVVPDQDKPGENMIKQAIELGWSVSFPEWPEEIKDAGEAVSKFVRLTTLVSIIKNVESNPLKSKLRLKI